MEALRAAAKMASTAAAAPGGGEGRAVEWTWSKAMESGGMERRKARLEEMAEEGDGRRDGGLGMEVGALAVRRAAEEWEGAGRGRAGWAVREWRLR